MSAADDSCEFSDTTASQQLQQSTDRPLSSVQVAGLSSGFQPYPSYPGQQSSFSSVCSTGNKPCMFCCFLSLIFTIDKLDTVGLMQGLQFLDTVGWAIGRANSL